MSHKEAVIDVGLLNDNVDDLCTEVEHIMDKYCILTKKCPNTKALTFLHSLFALQRQVECTPFLRLGSFLVRLSFKTAHRVRILTTQDTNIIQLFHLTMTKCAHLIISINSMCFRIPVKMSTMTQMIDVQSNH